MSGAYARGGLVVGVPVTITIETWECIIGRDRVCKRTDDAHDPDRAPLLARPPFWVCGKRSA